jgi:hypothetical protein
MPNGRQLWALVHAALGCRSQLHTASATQPVTFVPAVRAEGPSVGAVAAPRLAEGGRPVTDDVVDIDYVAHYRHGPWRSRRGLVRCTCGVVLYASHHAPQGADRRLWAALALSRGQQCERDGYEPDEGLRRRQEALQNEALRLRSLVTV